MVLKHTHTHTHKDSMNLKQFTSFYTATMKLEECFLRNGAQFKATRTCSVHKSMLPTSLWSRKCPSGRPGARLTGVVSPASVGSTEAAPGPVRSERAAGVEVEATSKETPTTSIPGVMAVPIIVLVNRVVKLTIKNCQCKRFDRQDVMLKLIICCHYKRVEAT